MFLVLAVVGAGAVLAVVVLLDEEGIHGEVGVDTVGDVGHLCHLFHHDGIVDGIGGSLSP